MRTFCFIFLFSLGSSSFGSSDWLYYKHYPWVYDNYAKSWLYLIGRGDGKVYAYHTQDKTWREFKVEEREDLSFDPEKPPGEYSVQSANQLPMLWVEPGSFTMGSPNEEPGRSGDELQYLVTLTHGFYLGQCEVTQLQYESVMNENLGGLNPVPSKFSENPNHPVENVSWNDVQIFLLHLNALEKRQDRLPEGWSYVLPTEAEWEYSCRAGTTSTYPWGDTIQPFNANYTGSNLRYSLNVGQYSSNNWGFYDMNGNVWEWTADRFGDYPTGNVTDPVGPESGSNRIRRGGSMNSNELYLRSAERSYTSPDSRKSNLGFRLALKKN
jgi:formylglycine-generating enzyme